MLKTLSVAGKTQPQWIVHENEIHWDSKSVEERKFFKKRVSLATEQLAHQVTGMGGRPCTLCITVHASSEAQDGAVYLLVYFVRRWNRRYLLSSEPMLSVECVGVMWIVMQTGDGGDGGHLYYEVLLEVVVELNHWQRFSLECVEALENGGHVVVAAPACLSSL